MTVQRQLKYGGLIAACGMNCGLCIGYLRQNKPCVGCFKKVEGYKPQNCRSCSIVNCEYLEKTESGFCFDCEKFPCNRIIQLDKRYRTNYGMSMIENLKSIQKNGLTKFLENEENRWKCKECGSGLCVHRDFCLNCEKVIN